MTKCYKASAVDHAVLSDHVEPHRGVGEVEDEPCEVAGHALRCLGELGLVGGWGELERLRADCRDGQEADHAEGDVKPATPGAGRVTRVQVRVGRMRERGCLLPAAESRRTAALCRPKRAKLGAVSSV